MVYRQQACLKKKSAEKWVMFRQRFPLSPARSKWPCGYANRVSLLGQGWNQTFRNVQIPFFKA